jgi:hypothetical protein
MAKQTFTVEPGGISSDPMRDARGTASSGLDKELDRRTVLTTAVGLAAVGVMAGSILAEATASPALAAGTSEQGAVAPAVVNLTDAPSIIVDASLGNDFRLTIGGNRTMGNPSNALPGQQIIFQVTQGTGAPFTLTWGSSYQFSAGLPQPALSTTAGQTDLLGFMYDAATGTWLLAAFVNGFN